MPELSDDMYCSQQIMVPPMFPYILRQYAKAAIRSQPTDLLRWSTAYFRCLSLNLPPPVKPRLEYPLPKDYDGVTPGWLKALLYQLVNNSHVDFKVLWDRWIGACQNHLTLIKILCLGGFTDPMAVPLLRFIGLCVGFLSENLTQTMILFCDVVTEEPEGGSAMIPVETFIDVYTFLAGIDASKDQVLLNRYFPDELLALIEKKVERKQKAEEKEEAKAIEKEASTASETIEEEDKADDGARDAISCPDLVDIRGSGDVSSEDSDVFDQGSKSTLVDDKERIAAAKGKTPSELETVSSKRKTEGMRMGEFGEEEGDDEEDDFMCVSTASALIGKLAKSTSGVNIGEESDMPDDLKPDLDPEVVDVTQATQDDQEDVFASAPVSDVDVSITKPTSTSATGTSLSEETDKEDKDKPVDDSELNAPSTTASLNTLSFHGEKKPEDEAAAEEDAINIDKYVNRSVDDGEGVTESLFLETEVVKIKAPVEELGEYSIEEPEAVEEEDEMGMEGKFVVEEIFVEAIPGIGPVVPNDLVEVVVEYMKVCAAEQHGMVMPRNIRHYSCPPLEVYQQ